MSHHENYRIPPVENCELRRIALPREWLSFAKVQTMDNKEKVRLLRLHRAVCQRNLAALLEYRRQCYERDRESMFAALLTGRRVRLVRLPEPEYEPYPDVSGLQCGARTHKGTPCKLREIGLNGRCKFHGGRSTGAKTVAGQERQRAGYRAWLEKQRASKAGRKRTRTYTSDVIGIGSSTLSKISASISGSELQTVSGIRLRLADGRIVATLPGDHGVTVELATTSPKYGGVRWWYVCPVCKTRKAALYLSGPSLQCRQCAGIHYASQSKTTSRNP